MSIFLRIDGITGEASDKNHKGWIDIVDFKWGTRRGITSATSTRGDRESGNAAITDLEFTKLMDIASPKLFLEACCGTGKDITLELTKTGQGQGADTYMAYTLKKALISHYGVGGNAQDITRPMETLTISFTSIETRYTPYDDNGKVTAPMSVGFDTATNTKR
ncbi:MAG: type VI secretion system tube protein Hcp [Gammaproteobacteria bacterium]|nr:type VI secretion system tube protein Hcp [Gammaproteobacteria bacterium]